MSVCSSCASLPAAIWRRTINDFPFGVSFHPYVSECNRVTPFGEIVVSPLRGRWMGNRGCIHRGRDIVRPWATKRWITCALQFKGWVAPKWVPGRWTALFFYDEALALAAGHRPCALCRRSDYKRYQAAAGIFSADAIDARLHVERLDGKRKRTHPMSWRDVPAGAFVALDGVPHVVHSDYVRAWSSEFGYAAKRVRPTRADTLLITPPLSVQAIACGYVPQTCS
jgi:hypothetical protein